MNGHYLKRKNILKMINEKQLKKSRNNRLLLKPKCGICNTQKSTEHKAKGLRPCCLGFHF